MGSKTEKQKKRVGGGMQKGHQGCVRVKEVCCHPDGGKMDMGRTQLGDGMEHCYSLSFNIL